MKGRNLIFRKFLRSEDGATSIEYALIASLFAIVCLSAITAVGDNVSVMWGLIDSAMAGAQQAP